MFFDNEIYNLTQDYGKVLEVVIQVKKWGYPGSIRTPTGNISIFLTTYQIDTMGDLEEKENIETINVKNKSGKYLYDTIQNIISNKYKDYFINQRPTLSGCIFAVNEANR